MARPHVKLTFPEDLIRTPVLAEIVRQFDVAPNIRRAAVEEHSGWIVCDLEGTPEQVAEATAWLRTQGVGVDLLGDVLESYPSKALRLRPARRRNPTRLIKKTSFWTREGERFIRPKFAPFDLVTFVGRLHDVVLAVFIHSHAPILPRVGGEAAY